MTEEAAKSSNLRADLKPTSGYVLTVDGKMKASYETEEEATAAGSVLKQQFPVIRVAVYDAAGRIYTVLNSAPR